MNNILKLILSFLLFTLLSNPAFATISHGGKESNELSYSARKLGLKTAPDIKKNIGIIERWSPNWKKTNITDASLINKHYPEPPHLKGSKVVEFEAAAALSFVRVHGASNKARPWVMKQSDIEGLSPTEIAKKFNIPDVPTRISKVTIPKGTNLRTGVVGPNKFGKSQGAIQFEIQMPSGERIPESWFQAIREF